MRGLTVVVATADPARLHAALSLAAAAAAAGAATRLYFHADAVALAAPPHAWPDDARYAAAGLPSLAALFDEALAMGVRMIACQTGLALTGSSAGNLDTHIETGGLVSLLASLGDGRLVTL